MKLSKYYILKIGCYGGNSNSLIGETEGPKDTYCVLKVYARSVEIVDNGNSIMEQLKLAWKRRELVNLEELAS